MNESTVASYLMLAHLLRGYAAQGEAPISVCIKQAGLAEAKALAGGDILFEDGYELFQEALEWARNLGYSDEFPAGQFAMCISYLAKTMV